MPSWRALGSFWSFGQPFAKPNQELVTVFVLEAVDGVGHDQGALHPDLGSHEAPRGNPAPSIICVGFVREGLAASGRMVRKVATAPDNLSFRANRDRDSWSHSPWVRRILLVVPTALMVAALLNVFGQRPVTSVAAGPQAKLTVYAPTHARSGLVYAARFRIDAIHGIKHATLVFDPGWADGYTVNGLAPQPLTEASEDGKLEFGFGHVAAGTHLTFWMSLQINPTNVGRHQQDVWLEDATTPIAHIHRTITIYP